MEGQNTDYVGQAEASTQRSRFNIEKKWIIIVLCVVVILIIIAIIISIIISKNTNDPQQNSEDDRPLYTDTDMTGLSNKMSEVYAKGVEMPDNEAAEFYESLISGEKDPAVKNGLLIEYARDLARRAYVYGAIEQLEKVNVNDLMCPQEVNYYAKYRMAYELMGNENMTVQYEEKLDSTISQCEDEGWNL